MDQSTDFDPNPGLGQVPFWDKIRLVLTALRIPWLLITFIIRRLTTLGQEQVPLKRDLPISIIRGLLPHIPLSIDRALNNPDVSKILTSPRFLASHSNIHDETIRRPEFSGRWICKGAPGHATPPAACDIVLYYLHGGGYRVGSPTQLTCILLRIAELAAEKDISIAVFGLEYSLTPEATFPTQVNQAVAGYRYLTRDLGIATEKLGVLGYSAGGHLALCLVSVLDELGVPAGSPPLGAGVFLVSPWIDLRCSSEGGGSYLRNKERDFISARDLRGAADMLLRSSSSSWDHGQCSRFVNFGTALGDGRAWGEVLQCKVWVAAGSDEIFLSDISRFVHVLRRDGVEVEFDVAEGGMHGGRLFDDAFDERAYLASIGPGLPDGTMKGSATLARAILSFNGIS